MAGRAAHHAADVENAARRRPEPRGGRTGVVVALIHVERQPGEELDPRHRLGRDFEAPHEQRRRRAEPEPVTAGGDRVRPAA